MVERNTKQAGELLKTLEEFFPGILGPVTEQGVRRAQSTAWVNATEGYSLDTSEVAICDFAGSYKGYHKLPRPGEFKEFIRNGSYKPINQDGSPFQEAIDKFADAGIEFDIPLVRGKPDRSAKVFSKGVLITEKIEGRTCFLNWSKMPEGTRDQFLHLAQQAVNKMGEREFGYRAHKPGSLRKAYENAKKKGLSKKQEAKWHWIAGILNESLEKQERRKGGRTHDNKSLWVSICSSYDGKRVSLPKRGGWNGETVTMGTGAFSTEGGEVVNYLDLDHLKLGTLMGCAAKQHPTT